MVLEKLKENQTVEWAVDLFVKVGTVGFLAASVLYLSGALFDLSWNISLGM